VPINLDGIPHHLVLRKGCDNLRVVGQRGGKISLHNGPYTRRWAYRIAGAAGRAAIDVLLGVIVADGDPIA
jgi:hypothetical protein